MLKITVPPFELWDETKQEFIYSAKEQHLQLEHSLVSISKWESKWEKPFLKKDTRTQEELIDYIRCMTLTQNVDPMVYYGLTQENIDAVTNYLDASMTATTFPDDKHPTGRGEVVTSELIYYWMIALGIPFECQKWHLNRLLTLVRICNIKNQPPKKMGRQELLSRNAALNKARRAKLNSRG